MTADGRYCSAHKEKFEEVETFFEKHKDRVIGFISGVVTETIVDDGYDQLKRLLAGGDNGRPPRGDLEDILRLVAAALPTCVVGDTHFKIEFLLASTSAPFSLFECHFPKNPLDGTPSGLGVIGVFYNDGQGRRFVGEVEGVAVAVEHGNNRPTLVSTSNPDSNDGPIFCYELRGQSGHERLEIAREWYFIDTGKLRGSGSMGRVSWRVPPT